MNTNPIPSDADLRLNEILEAMRQAILDRAVRKAKGPTLKPSDIEWAVRDFCFDRTEWPQEVADYLID